MFVDDTDLNMMGDNLQTSEQVFLEMQESLYMRGDLLLYTGEALKPDNCFLYLVEYECEEGEWKHKPPVDWETMVSVVGVRYVINHSAISALIAEWLITYLKPSKAKSDACHAIRRTFVRDEPSDNEPTLL